MAPDSNLYHFIVASGRARAEQFSFAEEERGIGRLRTVWLGFLRKTRRKEWY